MLLNVELQIFLIISSLVFFLIVCNMSIKKKISIRYSILWIILSITFIGISIFPNIVTWFSNLVQISEPVHTVLLLVVAFILLVIFSYNNSITKLTNENRLMIQKLGMLEKKISDLEKEKGEMVHKNKM